MKKQKNYYYKLSKAAVSNSVTYPQKTESINNLIDLYEAWGKPEKAEKWQTKLPQTKAVDE